jgi:hypothetical protein
MIKRLAYISIISVLVVAVSGCAALFGPNVQEVEPADLDSYEAENVVADDEDAVFQASTRAANGSGGDGGASAALTYVFQNQVAEELGQPVASFRSAFNQTVNRSLAAARAVTVEDNSEFSEDGTESTIDYLVTITDEEISGADVDAEDGAGTATITQFELDVDGSSEIDPETNASSAQGRLSQSGNVVYEDWTTDGDVVIHDGEANTQGNGRIDVEFDGEGGGSLSWRFSYALSAGFSFTDYTDSDSGTGGKIIIDFTYSGNENVEITADENIDEVVTGNLEAEMTVRVYDNNGELVSEQTYEDDRIWEDELDTTL